MSRFPQWEKGLVVIGGLKQSGRSSLSIGSQKGIFEISAKKRPKGKLIDLSTVAKCLTKPFAGVGNCASKKC